MTGGLTRKIARQPAYWVRIPPSTMPALAPAAVAPWKMPSARARPGPSGNRSVTAARAMGATSAALAPWANRDAISTPESGARPATSDVRPKRPARSPTAAGAR